MQAAGKNIFITGGGGGIGGGIAQAFAERGATVILADIDLTFAREEAGRLPDGANALVVGLDVTSPQSWASAKQQAEAAFGPVDILCNNAGITTAFKPLVELTSEEFSRLMAINVTGVFNGIQAFAGEMTARGHGHIVNTSSMNGLGPFGNLAAYCASKFGVFGMSDALRDELAPFGVGVSTLFPGLTRSRMSDPVQDGSAGVDPEHLARMRASLLNPLSVGRTVVRAVENNAPYIITHPGYKDSIRARFDSIIDAFGEPAQPVSDVPSVLSPR